jgi:phosphotransferase system  glucose/maltose/N-acetylglucosamine-specific IIC component
MSFFEYLANNLNYLYIVIGAIIIVIGAFVAKYFILKKWKKIESSKSNDTVIDSPEQTDENGK